MPRQKSKTYTSVTEKKKYNTKPAFTGVRMTSKRNPYLAEFDSRKYDGVISFETGEILRLDRKKGKFVPYSFESLPEELNMAEEVINAFQDMFLPGGYVYKIARYLLKNYYILKYGNNNKEAVVEVLDAVFSPSEDNPVTFTYHSAGEMLEDRLDINSAANRAAVRSKYLPKNLLAVEREKELVSTYTYGDIHEKRSKAYYSNDYLCMLQDFIAAADSFLDDESQDSEEYSLGVSILHTKYVLFNKELSDGEVQKIFDLESNPKKYRTCRDKALIQFGIKIAHILIDYGHLFTKTRTAKESSSSEKSNTARDFKQKRSHGADSPTTPPPEEASDTEVENISTDDDLADLGVVIL